MDNQQQMRTTTVRWQTKWRRFLRYGEEGTEFLLVTWGWLIFPFGILALWIPLFTPWPAIVFLILAGALAILLCYRFLGHADQAAKVGDQGKRLMFFILLIPFLAYFCFAGLYSQEKWPIPDVWRLGIITSFFVFVWLYSIALRWWYRAGEAMEGWPRPKKKQ